MNIFSEYIFSTLAVDSRGERDVDLQDFISFSLNEDTVIITDNFSFLNKKEKYKSIYYLCSEYDILKLLSSLKNKQVFIDVFIQSIINTKISSTQIYISKKKFYEELRSICCKNNINLITITNLISTRAGELHLPSSERAITEVSDFFISYNTKQQTINILKDREYSLISNLKITEWKKKYRSRKLEKLLIDAKN